MQKTPQRWQQAGIIKAGASYTQSEASNLHVSEVFPYPEFKVLDVGRAYPQGWPQRFGAVTSPHVHSSDLVSQRMVSEFPEGIKMTTTTPTTPTTAPSAPLRLQSATTKPVRPVQPLDAHTAIARHQHISNALDTASWHMRHGRTDQALGRIMSAARQLKQIASEKAGV